MKSRLPAKFIDGWVISVNVRRRFHVPKTDCSDPVIYGERGLESILYPLIVNVLYRVV